MRRIIRHITNRLNVAFESPELNKISISGRTHFRAYTPLVCYRAAFAIVNKQHLSIVIASLHVSRTITLYQTF